MFKKNIFILLCSLLLVNTSNFTNSSLIFDLSIFHMFMPDFIRTDVYSDSNGKAHPCMENCFKCYNSNSCEICVQGFFFNPHLKICDECPKDVIQYTDELVFNKSCLECVTFPSWGDDSFVNSSLYCSFNNKRDSFSYYYYNQNGILSKCASDCPRCTSLNSCIASNDSGNDGLRCNPNYYNSSNSCDFCGAECGYCSPLGCVSRELHFLPETSQEWSSFSPNCWIGNAYEYECLICYSKYAFSDYTGSCTLCSCESCYFVLNSDSHEEICLTCPISQDPMKIALFNNTVCGETFLSSLSELKTPEKCLQASFINYEPICMKCKPGLTPTYNEGCYDCGKVQCFERRAYVFGNVLIYVNFTNLMINANEINDLNIFFMEFSLVFYKTEIVFSECEFDDEYGVIISRYGYYCLSKLYYRRGFTNFDIFNREALRLEPKGHYITSQSDSSYTTKSSLYYSLFDYPSLIYKIIYYSFNTNILSDSEFSQSDIAHLTYIGKVLKRNSSSYFDETLPETYLNLSVNLNLTQTYITTTSYKKGRSGCAYSQMTQDYSDASNYFSESDKVIYSYTLRNCRLCSSNNSKNLIYDYENKICRFCPSPYRNCKSAINKTILVDCEGTTPLNENLGTVVVYNISDLVKLLSNFYDIQAYFLLNEMFVEKLQFNILFKIETACSISPSDNLTDTFLSFFLENIADNVISLKKLSIKIGAYQYDLDSLTYLEYLENDKKGQILMSSLPGLSFFNISSLEIRNMQLIYPMNENSTRILNIVLIENVFLKNLEIIILNQSLSYPSNFLQIFLENNTNVEIDFIKLANLNFLIDKLFYINLCEYVIFTNIFLSNNTFFSSSIGHIFYISSISFPISISYIYINDTNLTNMNIFSISHKNESIDENIFTTFKNVIIWNSTLSSESLNYIFFVGYKSCNITDLLISNSNFTKMNIFGDNYTSNSNINYVNIFDIEIHFSFFQSSSFVNQKETNGGTYNLSLFDLIIENNIFQESLANFNAIFILTIVNIQNFSFNNNTLNYICLFEIELQYNFFITNWTGMSNKLNFSGSELWPSYQFLFHAASYSSVSYSLQIKNVKLLIDIEPAINALGFFYFNNLETVELTNWSINFNYQFNSEFGSYDYFYFAYLTNLHLKNISMETLKGIEINSLHTQYYLNFQSINNLLISELSALNMNISYGLINVDNQELLMITTILIQSSSFISNSVILNLSPKLQTLFQIISNSAGFNLNLTIYNSTFMSNFIDSTSRPSLFEISALSSNVSYITCTFYNNTASNFLINAEYIFFDYCNLENIQATIDSNNIGTFLFLEFYVNSLKLQNISSSAFKFIPLLNYYNVSIRNSNFYNINSETAVLFFSSRTSYQIGIVLKNITLKNGYSKSTGGMMYFDGRGSYNLDIDYINISNSSALLGGLIFYVKAAISLNFKMINSLTYDIFEQNVLIQILISPSSNGFIKVYIKNVTAYNLLNSSNFLSMKYGLISIEESNFIGNAFGVFGLIFISQSNNLTIYNSVFHSNFYSNSDTQSPLNNGISVYLSNNEQVSEISLLQIVNTNIFIDKCKFSNNFCQKCLGGVLSYIGSSLFYILVQNSYFYNNTAYIGGSFFIYQKFNSTNDLTSLLFNNSFENNIAVTYGGVLYIASAHMRIESSIFLNNSVNLMNSSDLDGKTFDSIIPGKGGSIFYESDYSKNHLTLSKVSFINSSSNIGGAIFISQKDFYADPLSSIKYSNNTAILHGSNCYLMPNSIFYLNSEGEFSNFIASPNLSIINFKPGGVLKYLNAELKDQDNRTIKYFENSKPILSFQFSNLSENSNYRTDGILTGNLDNSTKDSIFVFSNISLIGDRNNTFLIKITSSLMINTLGTCVNASELDIQVSFRYCEIGEIYQVSMNNCDECFGSYSLEENATQCQKCDTLTMSYCEKNLIKLKQGYWRKNNLTSDIEKCKNESLCLGDELLYMENSTFDKANYPNTLCLKGHIGALCQACDTQGIMDGVAYFSVSNDVCKPCNETEISSIIFVFLLLFCLVVLAIISKGAYEMIITHQKIRIIKTFGFFYKPQKAKDKQIYVKALINYFQIIYSLTYLEIPMPEIIVIIAQSIGNPSQVLLHAGDCYNSKIVPNFPLIYTRTIFVMFIPLLYLGIYSLFYFSATWLKFTKFQPKTFYSTVLFCFLYILPNIVHVVVEVLSCSNYSGVKYIKADVSYECYTSEHILISLTVFIPLLVIWALVFPFLIFFKIWRVKEKLNTFENMIKYGLLTNEYRLKNFYWEFIKMYEKIGIIFFLNFFDTEIKIKGLMILLIIFLYYVAILFMKPYKSIKFYQLDCLTCFITYFTIFFGIFAYNNKFESLIVIAYVMMIVLNIFYFLYVVMKILNTFIDDSESFRKYLLIILPFVEKWIEKKQPASSILWVRARKAVMKYLREKKKKKETISVEKLNLREELDEEILEFFKKKTNQREFLDNEEDYNFVNEEIEEAKKNEIPN